MDEENTSKRGKKAGSSVTVGSSVVPEVRKCFQ